MRLRNQLAVSASLVTFLFITWSAVVAQQIYPTTGQDSFSPSTNAFPTSRPSKLDQLTGPDSEMSPDHWGSTANLEGENSYLTSKTRQPWDGEIETHPWLQQDEMAGFDPSNFPELEDNTKSETNALPVSAQPETQAEIPLPPSSSGTNEIPLPPSSFMSPPDKAEPRLDPNSTEISQPPLRANPTFGADPPYQNGSSIIREPADPPPFPALPSSNDSNDFMPPENNPRTVDYPNGDYGNENSSADKEPANSDLMSNPVPSGTAVPNSGPVSNAPAENSAVNNRPTNAGQPSVSGPSVSRPGLGGPNRYPFFNSVDGSQSTQQRVGQSQAVATPVKTNLPAANPGCGCNNPTGNPYTRPNFRPDLGFRSQDQVSRGMYPEDDGQSFDYEEVHYPSMREILKTGRYFGSADLMLLKPHFQGNTSIAQSDGLTQAFDFDSAFAPKLRVGFESEFGPGAELVYSQFDQNSDAAVFTSDGVVSGTTSVLLPGQNAWSGLTASNAGETLVSDQSLKLQQFTACMFKDLKFRRAKLNGIFGLQYIRIHQELSSYLLDSGGATIGQLNSRSDKNVLGPRVGFEYYRKMGHTGLILVNHFGGSVLFGNTDQYVDSGGVNVSAISGADELLSVLDIGFGIQKHKRIGETRSVFWKIGYDGQSLLGGGNASWPQADFGIRGYTFELGFNR